MPTPSGTIGMSNVNNEIRWPTTRSTGASERPVNILEGHLPPEVAWSRLRNKSSWVMINQITGVGAGGGLGPYNPLTYFPELRNGDVVSFDLTGNGWGTSPFFLRIFCVIGGAGFSGTRDYGIGDKAMRHYFEWTGSTFRSQWWYGGNKTKQYAGQQYMRKLSWWAYGGGAQPNGAVQEFQPQPWGGYTYANYDSNYANNNA